MIWIAPSEEDAANDALEKRPTDALKQLWVGAGSDGTGRPCLSVAA